MALANAQPRATCTVHRQSTVKSVSAAVYSTPAVQSADQLRISKTIQEAVGHSFHGSLFTHYLYHCHFPINRHSFSLCFLQGTPNII